MEAAIPPELAHELRAPLAAVITMLELITSPGVHLDPTEVSEIAAAAKADAAAALALIDRARGSPPEPGEAAEVSVGEVLRRVLDRFPAVTRRAALAVDATLTARIDPTELDGILTNLIQNVDRYAPEGRVSIRARRSDGYAVVEVADRGPGVSDPESIFRAKPQGSERGLHMGLSISRRVARRAGGELELAETSEAGSTFRLRLPAGTAAAPGASSTPRVAVLVELAGALNQRTLEEVEAGLSRIAFDLLGATGTALLVASEGGYRQVPGNVEVGSVDIGPEPLLEVAGDWVAELVGSPRGVVCRLDGESVEALLVVGLPENRRVDPIVFRALGAVASLGVERAVLGRSLAVERGLRESVMESLPIAISVFAGDPPQLIDMNAAERRMLGLGDPGLRPRKLEESQRAFDVRFADGTPLTLENAPVVQAIRRGVKTGPFMLKVRRLDGREIFTRTHCAPFFDGDGKVAGAVVTSEVVGSVD